LDRFCNSTTVVMSLDWNRCWLQTRRYANCFGRAQSLAAAKPLGAAGPRESRRDRDIAPYLFREWSRDRPYLFFLRLFSYLFFERSLGGGQAGDWHAERRTTDIAQSQAMTELY
jgi:hypothetical protein